MAFLKFTADIIGLVFSIFIAGFLWTILIDPYRYFIAVCVAIIFFFIYRYLVHKDTLISHNFTFLKYNVIFPCFVLFSILCLLLVHPIDGGLGYISWTSISPLNYLRLFTSLFITIFSPGYMILSLIDKKEKLSGLTKILFSVLTSLLFIPFIGLIDFSFSSSIQEFGNISLVLLNLILLIPFIFKRRATSKNEVISFRLNEFLVLFSLLIFIMILLLIKFSLNLSWDYGDLDIYYGFSVSLTKTAYPLSIIGPGINYPYWPFVFIAQFFIASGIPYVNAFQFLCIPISFLPVFSSYLMFSAFFNKERHKKIPIIATVFSFFAGGFGWLLLSDLFFNAQTVQGLFQLFTLSSRTGSGYLIPSMYSIGIYPLYTFALTSVFALFWLIYSERGSELGKMRFFIIPIMIALGYLSHIAEPVFFIFIFTLSLIIIKRENLVKFRKCTISIFFGFIIVLLADIITGQYYYTTSNQFPFFGLSLYTAAVVLTLFTFFSSYIKKYLVFPKYSFMISNNKINALKLVFSTGIIYFYGLSLIIWSMVFETYSYLPIAGHIVPWYGWANRLSITGLVALFAIPYLVLKSRNLKKYRYFLLLFFSTLFIARILHIFPSFYFEDRLTFFLLVPIIVLASYSILKVNQTLQKYIKSNSKNVFISFLLSIVLLFGFLPGLFTYEAIDYNYWSQPIKGQGLSSSEFEAFNFLRLNTPSNCSVLTFSDRSNRLLAYAGLSQVQTYINRDPSIILNPLFPETSIYSLTKSQIKFIYLTLDDEKELEKHPNYSGFVTQNLLQYLPIAYKNNEITIYEIPEFSPPRPSDAAIIVPKSETGFLKDTFDIADIQYVSGGSLLTTGNVISIETDNKSIHHDFKIPVDINPVDYNYVTIRWKTDGSNLNFYLLGSSKNYYTLLGNSASWTTTAINLNNFYDNVQKEKVGVEIGEQIISVLFRSFSNNSEYSIDYIKFFGLQNNGDIDNFLSLTTMASAQIEYDMLVDDDPNRFNCTTLVLPKDLNLLDEIDNQSFQRYLQWIKNGGRLIVLDTDGNFVSSPNKTLDPAQYYGWQEDTFLSNWTATNGIASSNGTVVTFKANNEKHHDLISPIINNGVSDYPYLVIRWKTDGSVLNCYPYGTQSNYHYVTLGASTKWVTTVINLKDFYDINLKTNAAFNNDELIDHLLFRLSTAEATCQIDYIHFYKTYPLPQYSGLTALLSIYVQDTTLANGVISATSNSNFSSSISVPIFNSDDATTKPLGSFTLNGVPVSHYAFNKKIGTGEVIYIGVFPYFSELKNSTEEYAKNLFKQIGSLISVLPLDLNKNPVNWTNEFPQFDYLKAPISLMGKISIDTNYIHFPKSTLDSLSIIPNSTYLNKITLDNAVIDQITYSEKVKFKISTSEANLATINFGKYSDILLQDFNLTIEVPKNDLIMISILQDGKLLNQTFQNALIQLNIFDSDVNSIMVKNPMFYVDGTTYFDRARLFQNYYKMPLYYNDGTNPFEITGSTQFKIEYSDNGLFFIDHFTFDGKYYYPSTETTHSSINELSIPWTRVLLSPYHAILFVMVFLPLIAYIVLSSKKLKIKIRRGH